MCTGVGAAIVAAPAREFSTAVLCSRLLVTCPASPSGPEALTSFSQIVPFLLLSGFDLCRFACKTRIICSIQKSDILCFQVLLSFVPTVLYFLASLWTSPIRGKFEPCRVPAPRTLAGTRAAPKSSNPVFNARIVQPIRVRFQFVSKFHRLFSITYWLRSYYSLFFSDPGLPECPDYCAFPRGPTPACDNVSTKRPHI